MLALLSLFVYARSANFIEELGTYLYLGNRGHPALLSVEITDGYVICCSKMSQCLVTLRS